MNTSIKFSGFLQWKPKGKWLDKSVRGLCRNFYWGEEMEEGFAVFFSLVTILFGVHFTKGREWENCDLWAALRPVKGDGWRVDDAQPERCIWQPPRTKAGFSFGGASSKLSNLESGR